MYKHTEKIVYGRVPHVRAALFGVNVGYSPIRPRNFFYFPMGAVNLGR
jgi:hypothetical protein